MSRGLNDLNNGVNLFVMLTLTFTLHVVAHHRLSLQVLPEPRLTLLLLIDVGQLLWADLTLVVQVLLGWLAELELLGLGVLQAIVVIVALLNRPVMCLS